MVSCSAVCVCARFASNQASRYVFFASEQTRVEPSEIPCFSAKDVCLNAEGLLGSNVSLQVTCAGM